MWMSKNLGKRQDTKTWNIFRLIKVEMFSSSNIEGAFQARDLRIEGSSGSGASPGFLILFSNLIIWRIWHIDNWLQYLTHLCLIPDLTYIHIYHSSINQQIDYLVLTNSSCPQFLANWPSVLSRNSCLTALKYLGSSSVHSRGLHQDKIHQPAN